MALVNEKMYLYILRTIISFSMLIRCGVNGAGSVTDVTSQVGLSNIDGVMAAFCDFDSDRDTDILVLGSKGMLESGITSANLTSKRRLAL